MSAAAMRAAAVSFTGGKDSMLALHFLLDPDTALAASASWGEPERATDVARRVAELKDLRATLLVTFVPAGGQPFKAHPLELVKLQARALGLPHATVEVSASPSFLESYRRGIAGLRAAHGVEALLTGDILDVCSNFMPRAAEGTNVSLLSPLWDIERTSLLKLAWAYGMRPLITCINTTKFLPPSPPVAAVAEPAATGGASPPAAAAAAAAAAATATPAAALCAAKGEGADAAAAPTAAQHSQQDNQPQPLPGVAGKVLGAVLDEALLHHVLQPAAAALGVDVAGEYGEFHTMITCSRLFSAPLRLPSWTVRQEGDYAFLALGGGGAALGAEGEGGGGAGAGKATEEEGAAG